VTGIVNTFLLIAAIIFFLIGIFFLLRALQSRMSIPARSYDVARQEARQVTLVNIARGIFFLILALILFAVMSLVSSSEPEEPTVVLSPTAELRPSVTALITPTAEDTVDANTPTVTVTEPSRTPFPTDTPEPTNTPILPSAVVSSPNGLWLRESPGGDQEIELLPDGSILILLQGLEIADGLEWQEVRTLAGNVGWVAVEFIVYEQ
jgi:hypothetical protein